MHICNLYAYFNQLVTRARNTHTHTHSPQLFILNSYATLPANQAAHTARGDFITLWCVCVSLILALIVLMSASSYLESKVDVESLHLIVPPHLDGSGFIGLFYLLIFTIMLHLHWHAGRSSKRVLHMEPFLFSPQPARGVSHSCVPLCLTAVQPA